MNMERKLVFNLDSGLPRKKEDLQLILQLMEEWLH